MKILHLKKDSQALLESYDEIDRHWNTKEYHTARNRATGMSTHDLVIWADVAGMKMCKVFYDYSREKNQEIRISMLTDLRMAISELQAVTSVLLEREI